MTRTFLCIAALALLCACGSKKEARSAEDVQAIEHAGRIEPSTDAERAILASLDELPAGSSRVVGQEKVVAGVPYFTASGTSCRTVSWRKQERLACQERKDPPDKKKGPSWYFAPNVFGAGTP